MAEIYRFFKMDKNRKRVIIMDQKNQQQYKHVLRTYIYTT